MKDCYQIIGTSWETVYSERLRKNEAEQDSHIRQRHDDTVRPLKALLDFPMITNEQKENYTKQIEECDKAYEKIATAELRNIYNEWLRKQKESKNYVAKKKGELRSTNEKISDFREKCKKARIQTQMISEKTRQQQNKYAAFKRQYAQRKPTKRTPYSILNIMPENLLPLSNEKRDEIVKEKKEELLKYYQEKLKESEDIIEKSRIIIEIYEIKEAYEQIETEEKREEYKKYKEKNRQQFRKQEIEARYSHMKEYCPKIIRDSQVVDNELFQNKLIEKTIEPSRVYAADEEQENRNLRFRRTAVIGFFDISREMGRVYEYEVKRTIDGKEKLDTVYTGISIENLMKEKRDGNNFDQNLYECIINELFSEEMIEASKYNEGYIGGIEKDEEGKYYTTLGKDRLSIKERKMLTAVILQKQKEKEEERGER